MYISIIATIQELIRKEYASSNWDGSFRTFVDSGGMIHIAIPYRNPIEVDNEFREIYEIMYKKISEKDLEYLDAGYRMKISFEENGDLNVILVPEREGER